MNKSKFIKRLELRLMERGLIVKERMEILLTYEEHFTAGVDDGKTEDEITAKLGKPEDIAMEYGEDNSEDKNLLSAGIIKRLREITKNIKENGLKNCLNVIPLTLILLLISFIWVLTIGITFTGCFGVYAGASSLINGKVVLFPLLKIGGTYEWFVIYVSIAMISGGALAFIGMYYVIRAYLGLMIKQVK